MTTAIDETKPARLDIRHWSWRRLMLALLLLFPIFGAIAWFVADADVHRNVNQRLAEYRSKGIPVSRDQIAVEIVPDDENQIFFVQRAMEALQISPADITKIGTYPRPKFEDNRDFYNRIIASNEVVFQHLAEAQRRKRASWNLELESPNWTDMRSVWRVMQLLEISAYIAALDGDYRLALVRLEQMRLVASALDGHPTYIGHMSASGNKQLICDILISISEKMSISDIDDSSDASREQVARMMAWLQDEDKDRQATIEHYRRQRVYAITTLQTEARKNRLTRFRHDGKILRMMNEFDAAERAVSHLSLPQAMTEVPQRHHDSNPFNTGKVVADFDIPIEPSVRFNFQSLTKKRIAVIALAMALYREDHDGAWPSTLEELTPKYLPRVPDDPMAFPAKPLAYLPDRFLIYSDGLDGVDGGGDDRSAHPYNTSHVGEWQRRDVLIRLAPSLAPDDPEEENE